MAKKPMIETSKYSEPAHLPGFLPEFMKVSSLWEWQLFRKKLASQRTRLDFPDSQPLGHRFVEKPFSRDIGLHPLAVDHKLWDGLFAGMFDDLTQRTGGAFNVNFFVRNVVLGQEALGLAAIGTPRCGINEKFHRI